LKSTRQHLQVRTDQRAHGALGLAQVSAGSTEGSAGRQIPTQTPPSPAHAGAAASRDQNQTKTLQLIYVY